MAKILDVIWFTEMGSKEPIGIVIGEDTYTKEKKAYIGKGFGQDEKEDIEVISKQGAKVTIATLEYILKLLKK